jgi:hypothetical protein
MGYQFLHIESYARSAGKGKAGGHSIGSILAEAQRLEGACPHVEKPVEPVHLFGCPLDQVEAQAIQWAASSVDAIGRKLRKDGLCLLSGVVSAPDDMSGEDWASMKRDTIEWLNRDGRLVSVVEHVDESHRHIHFYKLPRPGERFDDIHPGRSASAKAKAQGLVKGEQNQAYKKAMRGLQDDFFQNVGVRYGLTRLGPAKRRLTRSEWKNEQVAMQSLSEALTFAEEKMTSMEVVRAEAESLSAKAKADADAAQAKIEKSEQLKKSNVHYIKQWKQEKAATEKRLNRLDKLTSVGGFIGSFVGKALDAVRGVFIGRKAKEEAQRVALSKAKLDLKKSRALAEDYKSREADVRYELEASQVKAQKQLRSVAAELDAAERALAQSNKQALGLKRQGPRLGG